MGFLHYWLLTEASVDLTNVSAWPENSSQSLVDLYRVRVKVLFGNKIKRSPHVLGPAGCTAGPDEA